MRRRAADAAILAIAVAAAGCGRACGSSKGGAVDAGVGPRVRVDAAPRSVRDRPMPSSFVELARRLQLIGMHAPKRAFDICEPWAETYFNLMPIHEKLRGRDFPTIRNYLKVTLCNIHDEFTRRLDAAAVAAALGGD